MQRSPTNGAYEGAVAYLQEVATSFGLSSRVLTFVEHKPILLVSYLGSDPSLPSLLLNGHYDVVPAVLEEWKTKPFDAEERDGKIFARGTQDMKSGTVHGSCFIIFPVFIALLDFFLSTVFHIPY